MADASTPAPLHTVSLAPGEGAGAPTCEVRRIHLVAIEGPDAGADWTSHAGRCAIGSAEQNDVVLHDAAVSRYHCELTIDDGGIRLRDLASRNGTHVGALEVRDVTLHDGGLLRLGRTVLKLVPSAEPERVPVADGFGALCGQSSAMRRLFAQLARVADSRATLLLDGETGTGKTAAAETIHQQGARRKGPFVVVDCGAVPPALLESELFGHERGAFTGAQQRRLGAFEAAQGGTLFLDEIGELPLDLQPKLLRVLESRLVKRVGSNDDVPVDVRVVAATNRDLRTEVNAGRFRADLYYRLAVVTLRLPPLRERPEDLEGLVGHLLDELEADEAMRAELSSPATLARLRAAPWPGNVRELRNHLERCVVLRSVDVTAMPPARPLDDAGDEPDLDGPYAQARQRALDAFERRYVTRLLERSGGRVSDAAREAGLNRTYLYRLIGRHGLVR